MAERAVLISVLSLVLIMVVSSPVQADTLNVPGNYSTIQDAINHGKTDDVVLVAPGTYYENIDLQGKALLVTSDLGPEVTVIDGDQLGSVATFRTGEGPDTIIQGFTITNGKNTFGGAIFCNYSNPTIHNNIIVGNESEFSGGGICCWAYASPIITNNIIYNNHAVGFFAQGGGISCWGTSEPIITNNTIYGNTSAYTGGGIDCFNSTPAILNTIIWNNSASASNLGDQLYVDGSDPFVWFCNIEGGFETGNEIKAVIDSDPLFVDAASGDFHLQSEASPSFNAGSNFVDGLPEYALDGNVRDFNGFPDHGAYEYEYICLVPDATQMSASIGGTVNFDLDLGVDYADRMYFLVGSASGTFPGFIVSGTRAKMALNAKADKLFRFCTHKFNTNNLIDTRRHFDLNGQALATFTVTQNEIPPNFVGETFNFCYGTEYPTDMVSNPISISIQP